MTTKVNSSLYLAIELVHPFPELYILVNTIDGMKVIFEDKTWAWGIGCRSIPAVSFGRVFNCHTIIGQVAKKIEKSPIRDRTTKNNLSVFLPTKGLAGFLGGALT